jgi:hypothetical protein
MAAAASFPVWIAFDTLTYLAIAIPQRAIIVHCTIFIAVDKPE